MAISDHLVPLAADDPLLGRLRAFADGSEEPRGQFWEFYFDTLESVPHSIDMWRLGGIFDDALRVGLAGVSRREFLWTDGAEAITIDGHDGVTFLGPLELRERVAALDSLTREELDRRIIEGAGSRFSREDLVDWAAEVLEMMRWAAANNLGLLRDFSP